MIIYGTIPIVGVDEKYHYVYRITNLTENKHYYGSRTCKINPFNDLGKNYFSSCITNSWIIEDQKLNSQNYKYKIIRTFSTRKIANKFECFIHKKFNVATSDFFYNNANQTNTKFNSDGKFASKDKFGNIFYVNRNDPRFISGELVHRAKGNVTVKDKNNKTYSVSINDPRYISGELKHINSNKITVKDKEGNTSQIDKNDPRYISGELISVFKNKIVASDKNGKIFRIYKTDERFISGELFIVSGHENHNFKHWRMTPWGIFNSRSSLEPEIAGKTLDDWCGKRNNEKVTKITYSRVKKLKETFGPSCINKTFKELGFKHLTKEEYQQLKSSF